MPETSDPNYDDLKRRARRRLVGAVVLALAAAVFVPMLLESEQKPLGDDVSVRIPPVDDSKFVNQLSAPPAAAPAVKSGPSSAVPAVTPAKTDAPPGATAALPAGDPAPSPASSIIAPTPATTASAPPPANTVTTPASVSPSAPTAPRKSLAEAEQRVLNAPSGKATPAPDARKVAADATAAKSSAAPAVAKPAAAPASTGSFVVQLAAFSDDKGANALVNRLKKAGYTAFIEPVNTSHGTLWRVRVGPFTARDDANGARDRLKRDGYNGLVAANSRTP